MSQDPGRAFGAPPVTHVRYASHSTVKLYFAAGTTGAIDISPDGQPTAMLGTRVRLQSPL
eukprot:9826760-Karenia_brevis.AAC.1